MLFDVAPQPGNIPAYAGRTQERSLNAPYRQKHPRIRGENHRDLRRGRFFLETSPHTRGEPSAAVSVLDRPGNIPAYAGRTIYGEDVNLDAEKHPRIRGENHLARLQVRNHAETSPHTRGERCCCATQPDSPGNIPAYAGRTCFVRRSRRAFEKHPRIRGENLLLGDPEFGDLETSPHTRGELVWRIPTEDAHGNIPAYAGRTGCPKNPARLRQKHPRIRGENTPQHLAGGRITETSPHTRGEHRRSVFMRARQGNIPAYAGRTDAKAEKTAQLEKHPRIRGENVEALFGSASILETSPHTRGEPGNVLIPLKIAGNIPAYAGRTIGVKDSEVSYQKHPRIRGENAVAALTEYARAETSPHTRGEPAFCISRVPFGGNIPAYAGRTLVGDARPDDFEKHPRIRGENKPERTFPRPKTETSPHTRGELSINS